ncbi:MAG: 50S ribosomal protein L24, partial [Desulfobulbaceae bacterium]
MGVSRGTVQRIIRNDKRIVISGVNVVKKHSKARPSSGRTATQGGIIEFEAPIDISNVMLIDPSDGEPTRVGIRRDEDGRR